MNQKAVKSLAHVYMIGGVTYKEGVFRGELFYWYNQVGQFGMRQGKVLLPILFWLL